MDPYAPIAGISLELYAELSADVSDHLNDAAKQVEIVGKKGISKESWDAAKAGWTARMQDMSLMGQVAMRYMPLYQAALEKKSGGKPLISFEDYVAMSGAAKAMSIEGMLAFYKITMNDWTLIAGDWNTKIPMDMSRYGMFGMQVEQEGARIAQGGPPKPVNVQRGGAQPGMAQPAYPQQQQPGYPQQQPGYPQQQQPGYPQQQPGYPQQQQPGYPQQNPFGAQAATFGAAVGGAIGSFGSALDAFATSAVGGFGVGTPVLVLWSDGQRYPATITQVGGGQYHCAFPDGRQVWVPSHAVSLRS
jgi:hypothetical protein